MSINLIGFGCDLQQKLDAMDRKLRRARWAGYVATELYGIARALHSIGHKIRLGRATNRDYRRERNLMRQAEQAVQELGHAIEVYQQPDPIGWPLYIVFPGDVPRGATTEQCHQQGVAVPPLP